MYVCNNVTVRFPAHVSVMVHCRSRNHFCL